MECSRKFTQVHPQANESYTEQCLVILSYTNIISKCTSPQATFVKDRIVMGSPRHRTLFIMNYKLSYIMTKGFKVGITAMLARRTAYLGCLHVQILFIL